MYLRQGCFCKKPLPLTWLHAGWKSLPSESLCACCNLCAFLAWHLILPKVCVKQISDHLKMSLWICAGSVPQPRLR